jgi:hypothetical protein
MNREHIEKHAKLEAVPSSSTRRPNRSRWWRHPSSRSDRARLAPQARHSGCHPDAATCPCMACWAAGADAPRAASPAPPSRPRAAASWSRCSPSQSCAAPASARESASPSSPGDDSGTAPASRRSHRPEPASHRPGPAACRSALLALPPRSAGDSAETAAPSTPTARQHPAPTAPCVLTGSKHRETSASCGPLATSSGSSIRLPMEAENRTTRVLPNPDNSCATDT